MSDADRLVLPYPPLWSGAEKSSVNGRPFPSLIDVTAEQLNVGLESGQFTSVDLVNV